MSTYRGVNTRLEKCLHSVLNVKALKEGFQPGEGPSRGLLRDYEPSDEPSFQALASAG